MFKSTSDRLLVKRVLTDKCKIENCPRSKRIGTFGQSNFCKVHEVFIFLVKLKYSMKKLFGSLSAGFAVLKRESGEYFNLKDLTNFMNFLMIPFLLDDLKNVFEVLGKKHQNKTISIIRVDDLKKTMKSKEYHEIAEVEIRIIMEVISNAVKVNGMRNIINKLDHDKDGNFDLNDFVKTFRLKETQGYLFFKHVFKEEVPSVSKFLTLFPNNNELYLTLSDINANNAANNFFTNSNSEIPKEKLQITQKSNTEATKNLLEKLRANLKKKYLNFEEAFKNIANSNHQIGYFQVSRMLRESEQNFNEETCREVLSEIFPKNGKPDLQKFKEFWMSKKFICNYQNCSRIISSVDNYCEIHRIIRKTKALVLLEKLKSQTENWKSPKMIHNFYKDLEIASGKKDLVLLRGRLRQVFSPTELKKNDIDNFSSLVFVSYDVVPD
jgi:Ca2+-binding EF-hand superfamily protein